MATNINSLTPFVREMLDDKIISTAVKQLHFLRFGRKARLKKGSGDTAVFYDFNVGTYTTTPSADVLCPSGEVVTTIKKSIATSEYGQVWYVKRRDFDMHQEDLRKELGSKIGRVMGQSLDAITAAALDSGAGVHRSNVVSTLSGIVTGVQLSDLNAIVDKMQRSDAEKITEYIKSDPGYSTTPVRPCYVALVPQFAKSDFMALSGFVPAEKYQTAAGNDLIPEEFGRLDSCDLRLVRVGDYLLTANGGGSKGSGATELASTGGTNADIYTTIIVASDGYAIVPFESDPKLVDEQYRTQLIYNDQSDKADPSNKFVTIGWKANFGAVVFYNTRVYAYKHGVLKKLIA